MVRASFLATSALLALAASTAGAQATEMPCRREAPLDRLAERWSQDGGRPTRARLRAVGIDLPAVAFWRGRSPGETRRWLRRRAEGADAQLVCGVAQTNGELLVLAAPRAARLKLRERLVTVTLSPGFTKPRAVLLDAEGRPWRLPLRLSGAARWQATMPEDVPSPWRLQVLAEGPAGLRPVAELDAEGAWQPPWSLQAGERSVRGAAAGLGGLPSELGAWRLALGLARPRPNRLLGAVAAERARRACSPDSDASALAHGVSGSDGPLERLRARGLSSRSLGEVLARGRARGAILRGLLSSPSHVAVLRRPGWTDAGWAERVAADGRRCLAIVLARWPRATPVRSGWLAPGGARSGADQRAAERRVAARRSASHRSRQASHSDRPMAPSEEKRTTASAGPTGMRPVQAS